MSSLGDSQLLMPHGSDDGRGDEDYWTADGGGGVEADGESVTSDPDIPAKIPSLGRPDDSEIAMLDTSEPIKQRLRDLAAMFDTSSEPLQDGVNYALDILQMATEGKFINQGKETYVKRALVFFKHIAEMEKASSRRNVPGTASSTILPVVSHELGEFRWFLDFDGAHSLVKRITNRKAVRSQYFRSLKSLRSIISCTEKYLGLGKVGKLHRASLEPLLQTGPWPAWMITLRPIWLGIEGILDDAIEEASAHVEESMEDENTFPKIPEALHLGFFLRTLQSSQTPQDTRKRKRNEGQDHEASAQPTPAPLHEQNPAFTTVKELSFFCLAFENVEIVRQWKQRAYARFHLTHDVWHSLSNDSRVSFSYLVGLLTIFAVVMYQLRVYYCAEYFCGLVVAAMREAYESSPSDSGRIRLSSALGAYTIVALEARREVLAVRAVEEAIEVLNPLCVNDSSKQTMLMAALKIMHSFALSDAGKEDSDAQTQLWSFYRSARVASEAVDLARSTVEMDPADLESKNMLAYAFKVKANSCRLLSHSYRDLQVRHAKCRNGVKTTCTWMDISGHLISLADKHIDARYELEKVAGKTLGDLDVAAAVLEECIEVYRELAKKATVLFEPILAETINSASEFRAGCHPL
ncbi:hypothetical protein A4X13_0g3921 [Tilletia indica]|uniref:Uncharacterized protein n=1 Tax=Tilletia indica TaxID=43049 RepID=A0A177T3C0_9BASI|nr:hypothetical protein A4X13_0g3921 [Tilletia indica]